MTSIPASRMTRQEWLTDVFHSQLLKEDLKTKLPRGLNISCFPSNFVPFLTFLDLQLVQIASAEECTSVDVRHGCLAVAESNRRRQFRWNAWQYTITNKQRRTLQSSFYERMTGHARRHEAGEGKAAACTYSRLRSLCMYLSCRSRSNSHVIRHFRLIMGDNALPAALPSLVWERWRTMFGQVGFCRARHHLQINKIKNNENPMSK